jgi:Carbohydrate esterase, sialic acid-specific acetylesterase
MNADKTKMPIGVYRRSSAAICSVAVLLLTASARGAATLESPREYQVFQRETKEAGKIVVHGRAPEGCDSAEAAVMRRWQRLNVAGDCVFDGVLTARAGGWYTLTVRLRRKGRISATLSVAHVGIGEVFVISGQSNSTNYGEELQATRSKMVSTFNGTDWRVADDPQPGVQDGSQRGSFIPAFGDALYERLTVPVGVACVGAGGTSVRQWLPKGDRFHSPPTLPSYFTQVGEHDWESDGRLFDGMVERIRQLGRGGFRALLWHQGESDAHQATGHEISGAEYRGMMERLIGAVRGATWDFPWMVALVSYHTPADTSSPEIRGAQASLWRDGLALEGPDTDTLTGENRQNGGTGVHMSAKGLEAHGEMWAEKVGQWISRN